MKIKIKKEKIRKKKEEPPKVLVPVPSIYSVEVDPEKAQTDEFPKKIMEKLVPYYPLHENQTFLLEFELKDFEPGIIETFNVPPEHKHYGIYERMYFSRPPEKIIEDRLLAMSDYVGGFLRGLGFDVPARDIERGSGKIMARMKVKRLEKINNALKEYIKSKEIIEEIREEQRKPIVIPETFEIQVKDRYIWINNYLLSKPHAVGSNLEFFEYIQRRTPNTKIERNKLPDFGALSLKQEVKNKSFIKILNELGFKGEILKVFFPKRSKDIVVYRGNKITKEDLEKSGIKIPLFLKELELAHLKNTYKNSSK